MEINVGNDEAHSGKSKRFVDCGQSARCAKMMLTVMRAGDTGWGNLDMDFLRDYRFEERMLDMNWEAFPDTIKTRAKMCSIDLCGALMLGTFSGQARVGRKMARMLHLHTGELPAVGSRDRYNLLGAAMVMGHESNAFDIDDGYNMIKGHPGTSFVAGLYAGAAQAGATYTQFLSALTACYEGTIRWALAMQDHYGYLHSTGAYGAFGTALAIGKLLGYNREKLNRALSAADYHAPMTPVMRAVEFPSMNKDGAAYGAMTGTIAALEADCGATARTHLLELSGYRRYTESLGHKWYIEDLYFKPFTCCRWAHQPILAVQTLMREHGFIWQDVEKATVHTFRSAALLSKKRPDDSEEAQYNIAFPVAAAFVYGDVGYLQIRDEAVKDPAVLAMMQRLEFVIDPDMEKEFPQKRLAWIEVKLSDGRLLSSQVYAAPGEHTVPQLNLDWIIRKFKRVTAPVTDGASQEMILDLLLGNEKRDMQITQLIECINNSMQIPPEG